jgi:hypothetical protein
VSKTLVRERQATDQPIQINPLSPLKPRRGLFYLLLAILLLWSAAMVVMYFTTVKR